MGASESKPAGAHVWKSSGPSGVSQDLVESLQSSYETDASRSRLIEQQVQARVAEELKKLQKKEQEALDAAHEKLAAHTQEPSQSEPSRASVTKEIEQLRKQLEGRKQVRTLPDTVEAAQGALVRCLRENDRRPLDCWQEVETFKIEVKKLEKAWVDKVIS